MMPDDFKCSVCDTSQPAFSWTDTHGVAQCIVCGNAYRLFHYDEANKRIDKPPKATLLAEYVEPSHRCFRETGLRMPSGHSFPGGYEVANADEMAKWYEWMDKHGPKPTEATGANDEK